MPDVTYGPPSHADWSDWEERAAKAKEQAYKEALLAAAENALGDKSPDDPVTAKTPDDLGSNPWNIATKKGQDVTWLSALASELLAPSMVNSYLFSGPVLNDPNNMGWWSKSAWEALSDPGKFASDVLLNKVGGHLLQSYTGAPGLLFGAGRKFWDILTDTQDPAPVESIPVQDQAQRQGLKGTLRDYDRLMNRWLKSNYKPPTSTNFRYGPESPKFKGKAPKRESAFQRKQRKRKEEEEDAFQRMLMQYNQGMQNAISRPSIVPPVIWDAYVPDEGMSNYSVFDDIGRFKGIDMDAMLESMGVRPPE